MQRRLFLDSLKVRMKVAIDKVRKQWLISLNILLVSEKYLIRRQFYPIVNLEAFSWSHILQFVNYVMSSSFPIIFLKAWIYQVSLFIWKCITSNFKNFSSSKVICYSFYICFFKTKQTSILTGIKWFTTFKIFDVSRVSYQFNHINENKLQGFC